MKRGADVASYQGRIDFDALKGEVDFVVSKCTEGTGYRDPTFTRNWTECRRVGITPGAYHFARPDLGLAAADEAAYFLASIQPLEINDIIALDYEVNFHDPVSWCKAWLDQVRSETGVVPYIYLNLALVHAHDWAPVIAAGYPLWLACYDENPDLIIQTPWPGVAIKQWTSSGQLAGVPAPRVDLNIAYGGDEGMFSEADKAWLEQLVESKVVASEARVLAAVKDYNPLIQVARRIIRASRGIARDPGTQYPDDTTPIT